MPDPILTSLETKKIQELTNLSKLKDEYVTIIDTGHQTYSVSVGSLLGYIRDQINTSVIEPTPPQSMSFSIGEVVTGSSNSSASVVDVGEGNNIILNFSIPKGFQGDTGKEIELIADSEYIKWRYLGEAIWRHLIRLEDLRPQTVYDGKDGKSVYAINSTSELSEIDLKIGDLILYADSDIGAEIGDLFEILSLGPITYKLRGNFKGKDASDIDLSDYALKSEIPDIPTWALNSTKPSYTASEISGISDYALKTDIPDISDIDLSDYAQIEYVDDELSAIKEQIADLLYEEIQILSFTCNQSVFEKGSTVASVIFSWGLNKPAVSILLNTVEINHLLTSFTYSESFTTDKVFTLSVADERAHMVSRNCTVSFCNGVYWSVSEETEKNLTDTAWPNKVLSNAKNRSFTIDAGSTKYIYYAYPDRLGNVSFSVGGFTGGFSLMKTETFTNPSGYTELYRIYRSDNKGLGTTTVTVA